MNLEVALIPAQAKKWREKVCIVVDVLRTSSTIVTLMECGITRVRPAKSLALARMLANQEESILVGEHYGIQPRDFHFGNSPTRLARSIQTDRSAVLATTNGTVVLNTLRNASLMLIGCFLNANACCEVAVAESIRRQIGLGIVCAGSLGEFALDDAVCAGYLVSEIIRLIQTQPAECFLSDSATGAFQLYQSYPDVLSALLQSKSGKQVIEVGDGEDNQFCSQINSSQMVPVLLPGKISQLLIQPYFSRAS